MLARLELKSDTFIWGRGGLLSELTLANIFVISTPIYILLEGWRVILMTVNILIVILVGKMVPSGHDEH